MSPPMFTLSVTLSTLVCIAPMVAAGAWIPFISKILSPPERSATYTYLPAITIPRGAVAPE